MYPLNTRALSAILEANVRRAVFIQRAVTRLLNVLFMHTCGRCVMLRRFTRYFIEIPVHYGITYPRHARVTLTVLQRYNLRLHYVQATGTP